MAYVRMIRTQDDFPQRLIAQPVVARRFFVNTRADGLAQLLDPNEDAAARLAEVIQLRLINEALHDSGQGRYLKAGFEREVHSLAGNHVWLIGSA